MIGKRVLVVGNSMSVRIYHKGKLIEVHERLNDPNRSKSTKNHHRKPWEQNLDDVDATLQRTAKVGKSCERLAGKILSQGGGFVDLRMVWGILSLVSV
jgi:hypothetical protein